MRRDAEREDGRDVIRIGCSGWNHASWRASFYPKGIGAPAGWSMLWQLPANFHRDDERLAFALDHLPDGRHTFEFRHASWFCPEVYGLLRWHGVALTIADRPQLSFQTHELTADFTYVRFHHGHRGRRGIYPQTELAEWAQRIGGWAQSVDVYGYFNNDWEQFAPRNALAPRRMLDL